jgi:von Willebrand factor type A domain
LRREDFTIYDNGGAQTMSHFSRGPFPLAVVLLIDGSSRIRPYLSEIQIAALSALWPLRPEDQVALFSFGNIPAKLSDPTNDRLTIVKEINKIRGAGSINGTVTYTGYGLRIKIRAASSRSLQTDQ